MRPDRNPGPVVVCLHGSAGNSGMWREFVETVSDRCTVLAPQLELPVDPRADGSVEGAAREVLRRVDHIATPVHVVGHSYGGAVALQMAAMAPERVASLVLYEPAAPPPGIDVSKLVVPVRLLCGTRTWPSARRVIDGLFAQLADRRLLQLVGLRHMAPITHPHLVNPVILDNILADAIPEFFSPLQEGLS